MAKKIEAVEPAKKAVKAAAPKPKAAAPKKAEKPVKEISLTKEKVSKVAAVVTEKVSKAAPVTAKKPRKAATKAPAPPYEFQKDITAPKEGDSVKVTTENGVFNGSVSGAHEGLRIDVVLIPDDGAPFSLSTVNHQSKTDTVPYWA